MPFEFKSDEDFSTIYSTYISGEGSEPEKMTIHVIRNSGSIPGNACVACEI